MNDTNNCKDLAVVRQATTLCAKHKVPVLRSCPYTGEKIGQGGHAFCVKTTITTSKGEAEVVVKQMLPSRGLSFNLVLGELVTEAVLLARVSGIDGLPHLYGIVLDPPALVTSFDGPRTLFQVVMQRPRCVSDEVVVSAVLQVCCAVSALHKRRITHNDIKSDNVVVRQDSSGAITTCLIDLGNSSYIGQAIFPRGELRWEDHRFLAPELVAGDPSSAASDVFSLGYMMVTFAKIFKRHSAVGQLFRRVGGRATAKCPARRPSLQELIDSLEDALERALQDCKLS